MDTSDRTMRTMRVSSVSVVGCVMTTASPTASSVMNLVSWPRTAVPLELMRPVPAATTNSSSASSAAAAAESSARFRAKPCASDASDVCVASVAASEAARRPPATAARPTKARPSHFSQLARRFGGVGAGGRMAPRTSRSCASSASAMAWSPTFSKTKRLRRSSPNVCKQYRRWSSRARSSVGVQMASKSASAPFDRRHASSVFRASRYAPPRVASPSDFRSDASFAKREIARAVRGAPSTSQRLESTSIISRCRVRLSVAPSSRRCAATKPATTDASSARPGAVRISASSVSSRSASRHASGSRASSSEPSSESAIASNLAYASLKDIGGILVDAIRGRGHGTTRGARCG
mmetsp:Transcript_24659/g.76061  ORF Transcript_24659/g.76061 Transcript_24659/m.76061 type:complete len:351 (-) Transcript_24659:386-1438(-)